MININIDFTKIFDNLFSERELEILRAFTVNGVNVEYLKTLGDVEEIIEDVNGIPMRTVSFKSFDGQHEYVRSYKYKKTHNFGEKIRAINEQLDKAIAREDYEKAALLKKKKIKLLEETDN